MENTENDFNENDIDNDNENSNVVIEEKRKFDYDYQIDLTIKAEDGLIESYLFGNRFYIKLYINLIDNLHEPEKHKSDPSEWFNFGLDEDKWIKFVNKSILMHYEKNLIKHQLDQKGKQNNNQNFPRNQNNMYPQYSQYGMSNMGMGMPNENYQYQNNMHGQFPQGHQHQNQHQNLNNRYKQPY